MVTTVNITGINHLVLLHVLWMNQKPADFFTMSGLPTPPYNEKEAEQAYNYAKLHNRTIDYVCGRAIKINFNKGDVIDSILYDRDAGKGKCQLVVDSLRNK